MRSPLLWAVIIAAGFLAGCATREAQLSATPWWSSRAQGVLDQSGTNRAELRRALQRVPESQRGSMEFLVANMPPRDARTLRADYLLQNVALAHEAIDRAPWRGQIPREIFLNEILPYACMNERRDDWREKLRQISLPLIADCQTPSEAAQRLNQKLFPLLKVRYSTERKRADQCPTESMASGKATCTGLSILLVDACRAVGVPARVAGTPLWSNLRGNHTWVEIWDGEWHFTGAAEPDRKGLNRGWFVHDASQAQKDIPRHAIYATSFQKTGLAFPLVWAPDVQWVQAVNVTERYTRKAGTPASNQVRLLVKVLDASGRRVAARVTLRDIQSGAALEGMSKGESADLNDILAFPVTPGRQLRLVVAHDSRDYPKDVVVGSAAQEVVTIKLEDAAAGAH